MSEKWGFIVNPVAGGGRGERILSELHRQIKSRGLNASVLMTTKPGEGTSLAEILAERGFNPVVAVGGDGTVNEVVNGIALKGITLGVVPAGSGNDFVHMLGFPERFKQDHWDALFQRQTGNVDLGICNGRYFINGMGFGFDALVASEVSEAKGARSYLFSVIKNLLFYREPVVFSIKDGTAIKRNCFLKTVGIGRRFGGGFLLTVDAEPDDGLFDICTADKLSVLQRLKLLLRVRRGTHIRCKEVRYYRTDSVVFQCEQVMPYHIDGEVLYAKNFEVKIIPSAIEVIINASNIRD
ncbi:MAG: diacylglycerol kinase family lipid kinase [Nitrospirae bacterium]|nr:MAG: diacylglycerol kinase family lipid kinase [Nitrospirota bacterium]